MVFQLCCGQFHMRFYIEKKKLRKHKMYRRMEGMYKWNPKISMIFQLCFWFLKIFKHIWLF